MPLVKLSDDDEIAPNLAPMIDVILVLTIFFMCATRFEDRPRAIDVDLPQVGSAASAQPAQPLMIEVDAAGELLFAGEPLALAALTPRLQMLREERGDVSVVVRGARSASHGTMAEVYQSCRAAGIRGVAIADQTQPGRSGAGPVVNE